jgi:hypothetical protein
MEEKSDFINCMNFSNFMNFINFITLLFDPHDLVTVHLIPEGRNFDQLRFS